MATCIAGASLRRSLLQQFSFSEAVSLLNTSRRIAQNPTVRRRITTSTTPAISRTRIQPSTVWRYRTGRFGRQVRNKTEQASGSAQAASQAAAPETRSLSQKMKDMSKKYGWTVVGIYFGLSVLDFPFCFLAVRWFGADRIGEIEQVIVNGFWDVVRSVAPSLASKAEEEVPADATEAGEKAANAVEKHAKVPSDASIWTQLIIAYGVHKSLIFFRIPITLAITPRIVKTLRSWGWKIGPKVA